MEITERDFSKRMPTEPVKHWLMRTSKFAHHYPQYRLYYNINNENK